jgi:hypothetical protein
MITVLGIAVLTGIAMIVREVQAADKPGIAKIADGLKAGKDKVAAVDAQAYAKNNKKIDDLMEGFSKNELIADGIEKKLNDFAKGGPKADDFKNAEYKDIGATTAAIALVCDAIPAPKAENGSQKQWTAFSKELRDNGMKFQTAFAAKNAVAAKTAAEALKQTCSKCHVIWRK